MFFSLLSTGLRTNTQDIFLFHPEQLLRLMESVWVLSRTDSTKARNPLVHGDRSSLHSLLKYNETDLLGGPTTAANNAAINARYVALANDLLNNAIVPTWDHLIYAYMLENTRMVQIFRRVLYLFTHGEELGIPSPETVAWLRNTEMLFYRLLPSSYLMNLRSEVRPDAEATRRNAYYRMFGMDLGHGNPANKPYDYHKPRHANRDFVTIMERLLREIHQTLINIRNSSGANTSDFAAMAELFKSLYNMLKLRRKGDNLAREEFNAVALMSWLQLTLQQQDFPLFADLNAQANQEEDRLLKVGERVGLGANPKSGNFIQLGELLSQFLIMVENGDYQSVTDLQNLFAVPSSNQPFVNMLTEIITQWSIATGRDIKATNVRRQPALVG